MEPAIPEITAMALNEDIIGILQEVTNHRPEEVPMLMKRLEQLIQSCNKESASSSESDVVDEFCSLATNAYLTSMISAKLARNVYKLVKSYSDACCESMKEKLLKTVSGLLTSNAMYNVRTLSLLIDQNRDVKDFFKTHFEQISQFLSEVVSSDLFFSTTRDGEEYTYRAIKVCIQCQQLCSDSLRKTFASFHSSPSTNSEDTSVTESSYSCWNTVLQTLLSHFMKSNDREHLLLAGTALAMALNCAPTSDLAAIAYKGILSIISGDTNILEFCGIRFNKDASDSDINLDYTVHMVAIIKGLLASCSKETLRFGSHPLILYTYPHILRICRGPSRHHYLAFQTLVLWYEKLLEIGMLTPSGDCFSWVQDEVGGEKNLKHTSDVDAETTGSLNVDDMYQISDKLNHCFVSTTKKSCTAQQKIFERCSSRSSTCTSEQKLNRDNHQNISETSDIVTCENEKKPETSPPTNHDNRNNKTNKKNLETTPSAGTFMSRACPVLGSTLDCVWFNWESPVDGVPGYVLSIFQHVLQLWNKCVLNGTSSYTGLCRELFSRVLGMAWHSKTRYRPLRLLLPYIDCQQALEDHPSLKDELLQCMKSNSLASVASDTYKSLLEQTKLQGKYEKSWQKTWMATLMTGLTSIHELQRMKVSTYWLEPTLTLVPESLEHLLSHIERRLEVGGRHRECDTGAATNTLDKDLLLYAWTAVSRVARDKFHACVQLHSVQFLRAALMSEKEQVRAEAFFLISSTVKKSEALSETEIELLREFLPHNLKTDSSFLRHSLTTAVRKLLVRVRDSCLAALRSKDAGEKTLDQSISFVEWLYKLLMLSLCPGSSYQRRQTAYDLLFATLETLMYQKMDTSKKGKANESADTLVRYAQGQGLWKFFSVENFLILLACFEDGAEEIQNQSFSLLTNYFKWPTNIAHLGTTYTGDDQDKDVLPLNCSVEFVQGILNRAFYLVSRPRAYENHSGLLLFSLVLNKYVIGCGLRLKALTTEQGAQLQVDFSPGVEISHLSSPALDVVGILADRVNQSLEVVKSNIAANMKLYPIHGLLQCITRCLQDIPCSTASVQEISARLKEVAHINQILVVFVLEVLAGGKNLVDCPSFADIGSALENLVTADSEAEGDVNTTLSPDFQLLLSWCWLNIKECSTCLAAVTATSLQLGADAELDTAAIYSIGETFVQVLTTCRHRGAIEGCRSGLFQFSLSLMSSRSEELACIPVKVLQKVLSCLSENSLTSSVTRRSAGLPIIVQTVAQAACKSGNAALLVSTVEELYSYAIEPLTDSHSQQHDLRQSHALNILKTIFSDASLAPRLMPLVSKMVVLVIESSDSPSWSVRNAATQLVSILVTRIFGQRNKVSTAGSISLEEFEAMYPEVIGFVCSRLETYLCDSRTYVSPSLYVMLTLLANLGPIPAAAQHSTRCRKFLQTAAEYFLSSPVYSLRTLAAQVWVALSAFDQSDEALLTVLQRVFIDQGRSGLNTLHGWLLCGSCILAVGQISDATSQFVLDFCLTNSWLLSCCTSCLLVASSTIKIIQQTVELGKYQNLDCLQNLQVRIEKCLTSICSNTQELQVAKDHFLQECVSCLMVLQQKRLESNTGQQEPYLTSIMHTSLALKCEELQAAVLDQIYQSLVEDSMSPHDVESIETMVWNSLREPSLSSDTMSELATILVKLSSKKDLSDQPAQELEYKVLTCENLLKRLAKARSLGCNKTVFGLEGMLLTYSHDENILQRLKETCALCEELTNFSHPTANEDLRLAAATFLVICGPRLVDFCCRQVPHVKDVNMILIRLISAVTTLLEDTEDSVRKEAALFVSRLTKKPQMHFALAHKTLADALVERLPWPCTEICAWFVDCLYKSGTLLSHIKQLLRSEPQVLFEPETKSAMSESLPNQLWVFDILQRVVQKHPESYQRLLEEICTEASRELDQVFPSIQNTIKGNRVFNLSCDEDIFSCLLGLILLSDLSAGCCKSSLPLHNSVAQLKQMPGIHPLLRGGNFDLRETTGCP